MQTGIIASENCSIMDDVPIGPARLPTVKLSNKV